jgi:hypothetical protein
MELRMPDNESDQAISRIGDYVEHRTYHGPVEVSTDETDVQRVSFTGSEESDVLHAAGAWMADSRGAILISTNWYDAMLCPHDDRPRHRECTTS